MERDIESSVRYAGNSWQFER